MEVADDRFEKDSFRKTDDGKSKFGGSVDDEIEVEFERGGRNTDGMNTDFGRNEVDKEEEMMYGPLNFVDGKDEVEAEE